MVFKSFKLHIIFRVIILTAAITLLAWCIVNELYLRSVYLGVGVIILLTEFIYYVDKFNRDFKTFMISLQQRDFTTHFNSTGKGKSFNELYEIVNQISTIFKTISTEKEIQYRYLEMLVEHVRVGVLSIDENEKIYIANQALKDLFDKEILTTLKALEPYHGSFVKTVRDIRTGETQLVKLHVNNDLLQLSIHASEFKLEGKYYKLISMQNIRNELDAREIEAWQKLIRVLSHEIMNSVSPIISLSATLHDIVRQGEDSKFTSDQYFALEKGLDAIKIRSEGLFNFTQSYRKLTGIPKLVLKEVNVKDLIKRVEILMQPKLSERNIRFTTSVSDAAITVDPALLEHVFINLILNAIEAVAEKNNPSIDIFTTKHSKANIAIHVVDNGEGMDEATADKVFIPFFTTRKTGSGIGLAVTKQILQLHKAEIQFQTAPGIGTTFTVLL